MGDLFPTTERRYADAMRVQCLNCDASYNSKTEIEEAGSPPEPAWPLDRAGEVGKFDLDVQSDASRPQCPRCGNRTLRGIP